LIPIRDDNPTPYFPLVTILLILINVALHIYQISLGAGAEAFLYRFGAIPWELTRGLEWPGLPSGFQTPSGPWVTPMTSMFLHGSIPHLIGNMLYLWIFGDNVESLMGHGRFIFFYLVCGLFATAAQIFSHPDAVIPMVGASGAVSGVLGAYLIRFPRARVHVLFIWFLFIRIIPVRAFFVLGFWFLFQVFNGLLSSGHGPGVAWFAHVGGFLSGMILVFLFERKDRVLRLRRASW